MLKHQYGGPQRNDGKMDGQRYLNQQMQQSKRNKAQSGLAQITTQRSMGGGGQYGNLASDAKPGGQKYRQQRVRSQLGQHQTPLDQANMVQ